MFNFTQQQDGYFYLPQRMRRQRRNSHLFFRVIFTAREAEVKQKKNPLFAGGTFCSVAL